MTHVVNLLPWRDLRRRQRLRYTLLLAIGIVLLAGMTLQVGRTAGLQRDALARLHATADAALLASLKQREQAMREAWQQHQRQRQQYQRRYSAFHGATPFFCLVSSPFSLRENRFPIGDF